MPPIFNESKGTYEKGPVKIVGWLHWQTWRFYLNIPFPKDFYTEEIKELHEWWLDKPFSRKRPPELEKVSKRWQRQYNLYRLNPFINKIMATIPFHIIAITIGTVITW